MFRVYNMGVGFCVVVDPADADRVDRDSPARRARARTVIGRTVADPERRVWIPSRGLLGRDDTFTTSSAPPPTI